MLSEIRWSPLRGERPTSCRFRHLHRLAPAACNRGSSSAAGRCRISLPLPRQHGDLDTFFAYALPLVHDIKGPELFVLLVLLRTTIYCVQRGALTIPASLTETDSTVIYPVVYGTERAFSGLASLF